MTEAEAEAEACDFGDAGSDTRIIDAAGDGAALTGAEFLAAAFGLAIGSDSGAAAFAPVLLTAAADASSAATGISTFMTRIKPGLTGAESTAATDSGAIFSSIGAGAGTGAGADDLDGASRTGTGAADATGTDFCSAERTGAALATAAGADDAAAADCVAALAVAEVERRVSFEIADQISPIVDTPTKPRPIVLPVPPPPNRCNDKPATTPAPLAANATSSAEVLPVLESLIFNFFDFVG